MNVDYLIQILQNKIMMLNNAKNMAFAGGDMETINAIDKQLFESQTTLSQLEILRSATEAAAANNTSASAIIANSIDALQNTVQGPSAAAVINGYDISAYATDALYEQKITNILAAMPSFEGPADMDAYIQFAAPGSPVTSVMVMTAAATYAIDLPLLVAIMQNDSNFGTLGIGARTNNPGNVGNTGTSTQSYASWDEGVSAVAEWLSRHRAVITPVAESIAAPEAPVIVPEPDVVVKKKKKKVIEDPVDATTTPPVIDIPPVDATSTPATTTPPIDTPPDATSTPSIDQDTASSTATTTP